MLLTKGITCIAKQQKTGLLSAIIHNNLLKYVPKECLAATPSSSSLPSGAQPIGKRRFRLPVEQDVNKLVNYCCGANYYKEGEDIKLKADEEYPQWIWSLRLNYPPPLHQLDPNTKEFYERLAIVGQQREWRMRSVARKRYKVVSERLIALEELKYRRRFRALAHKEFDAGYEVVRHSEREDYWNLDTKERYRQPEETEPFYPGIDSVDIPYFVQSNRLHLRPTKKCGHFGW